ncbi:MAG: HEPN domain-containing protein [Parcubacteria group bacterium]|nr:HEPN domain-containing protein [Parcubacteria group bacterium]
MAEEEKNYEKWFKKAQDDSLSIFAILEEKHGSPNTACFLAQQMTEKYLKGFLVSCDIFPPKTHDLLRLASLIIEQDAELGKELEKHKIDLDTLNNYYIETRYPGDFPEFHWGNAEEAFQIAKRIKQFVLDGIVAAEAYK